MRIDNSGYLIHHGYSIVYSMIKSATTAYMYSTFQFQVNVYTRLKRDSNAYFKSL